MDLGGSYVGPTQNRLLRLARELGIKTYLVDERQHIVMFQDVSQLRFFYIETSSGLNVDHVILPSRGLHT